MSANRIREIEAHPAIAVRPDTEIMDGGGRVRLEHLVLSAAHSGFRFRGPRRRSCRRGTRFVETSMPGVFAVDVEAGPLQRMTAEHDRPDPLLDELDDGRGDEFSPWERSTLHDNDAHAGDHRGRHRL
jgi:hypothetical protein